MQKDSRRYICANNKINLIVYPVKACSDHACTTCMYACIRACCMYACWVGIWSCMVWCVVLWYVYFGRYILVCIVRYVNLSMPSLRYAVFGMYISVCMFWYVYFSLYIWVCIFCYVCLCLCYTSVCIFLCT